MFIFLKKEEQVQQPKRFLMEFVFVQPTVEESLKKLKTKLKPYGVQHYQLHSQVKVMLVISCICHAWICFTLIKKLLDGRRPLVHSFHVSHLPLLKCSYVCVTLPLEALC